MFLVTGFRDETLQEVQVETSTGTRMILEGILNGFDRRKPITDSNWRRVIKRCISILRFTDVGAEIVDVAGEAEDERVTL